HANVERIEARRRGVALRISLLRRAEAGGRRLVADARRLRDRLRDAEADDVRTVEREQVLAAEAVEVDVALAIPGAHHGAVIDLIRRAETRGEVVAIGVDER